MGIFIRYDCSIFIFLQISFFEGGLKLPHSSKPQKKSRAPQLEQSVQCTPEDPPGVAFRGFFRRSSPFPYRQGLVLIGVATTHCLSEVGITGQHYTVGAEK